LAAALHNNLGVPVGANIAILALNSIESVEASIAIASAGGRPVPINWHWKPREIAHVLVDAQITTIFIGDAKLATVARRAAELAGLDGVRIIGLQAITEADHDVETLIAAETAGLDHVEGALAASLGLIYTSGTTGSPKGVARETMTATQILSVAGSTAQRMGLRDGGAALIAGPLYHTSPQAIATLALRMGSHLILMERFDAGEMLQLIEDFRVEHVKVVPTMLSRILSLPEEVRRAADLSSLTHVVHSAAPCPPEIKRGAIDLFGSALVEFYGCTEAGTITWITADEWLAHPGSVGRPADGAAVRVVDENDEDVAPGTHGRVLVRGASYWPRFAYLGHGDVQPEFIDVGDIGYLDEDGWLYLVGRSAEIVIIGGTNVYVAEIESVALAHPDVEDAAAIGTPAEEGDLGEQIMLLVVPRPGHELDPTSVAAHLVDNLASVKLPRRILVKDSLPRDDNGKLYRRGLVTSVQS
jgi:long-chain acyl-CoA synthetase